jgi:hypothetical protein
MATTLVLTIAIQLLKILYQFKILKTDETIKELERRLKSAVNSAEGSALDSVILTDQHKSNESDLQNKATAAWGDDPNYKAPDGNISVSIPVPDPEKKEPFFQVPSEVLAGEFFYIECKNLQEGCQYTIDLGGQTFTATKFPQAFKLSDKNKIVKVSLLTDKGVIAYTRDILVKTQNTWNTGWNG